MTFWRNPKAQRRGAEALALVCVLLAAAAQAEARQQPLAVPKAAPARVNELTLGQLRPGKSTLADADKLFGVENRTRPDEPDTVVSYLSSCWRSLQLELDAQKRIMVLTLSDLRLRDSNVTDCSSWDAKDRVAIGERWKTGRGIRLGSTRKQVLAAYGAPGSSGPSTQNGRELELLYYAFDWAGPEVPQVMEITLERGRVVQITLAFPSL